MKLIIFGTGRYYQNRKEQISADDEIIVYLDNSPDAQGRFIDGIPVVAPCEVSQFAYDMILLMSVKAEEMKKQLEDLGICEEKIWEWERFIKEKSRGMFRLYCGCQTITKKKKILIISTDLQYNGGSLAAVYAAQALQRKEYNVLLAAPGGDGKFISETVKSGVNVAICQSLPYIHEEEMMFVRQFDAVIINVFQMIACACEISRVKPAVWWIHEPGGLYEASGIYEGTIGKFRHYADQKEFSLIKIYAVSSVAQRCFNACFPDRIQKTLRYGIPDGRKPGLSGACAGKEKGKLVFAIIGSVIPRKAQDIFLYAVGKLDAQEKENVEFWIIGDIGDDEYSKKVRALAKEEPSVKIFGRLSRYEIDQVYEQIDVLVCPSLEDPLPIVATEGMMYGKICIISDTAGTAEYITEGKNGFVCKANDADDLCETMRRVINGGNEMTEIRKNARETYEQYFTMEQFAGRLEEAVAYAVDRYGECE